MKKYLFLLALTSSADFLQATTTADPVWADMVSYLNQIITCQIDINNLTSQQKTLQATQTTLTSTLTDLQTAAQAAADQAATVAAQQKLASMESNLMLRGKINSLINNTDISFAVVWPDESRTIVGAQSQQQLNQPFSQYSEGGLIGGVISIIPQVNGSDISSGNAETQAVGLSYSLTFNLQGLNESGYAYGALNALSVTRTYPSASTRAHSLNVDDLVADNEIWAVDLTLNYLPGLGDGATFIYPRWSTLYKNSYDATDTAHVPDIFAQNSWSNTTAITTLNSSADLCYPDFTGTTASMWGDLLGGQN